MEEKLLSEILAQMVRIADSLDIIARAGAPQEPNYIKPIGEFAGFDWTSIGATIVNQDTDGPTHLEWGGFVWTRRSPVNKFKPAIWYSRASGKDAEGNVNYLKLITFKTIEDAEPIPGKVAAAIPPAPSKPPAVPSKPTAAPVASTAASRPATSTAASLPASGPQPAAEMVDTQTYYTQGNGKRWNLPRDWLANIAKFAGVDVSQRSPNFAQAFALLPFFAEGKANGLDFDTLTAILRECRMSTQDAVVRMRAQVPAVA
jgi:hypothetical protein